MFNEIKEFLAEEDGPTAAEYAVMLGAIFIVVLIVVNALGQTTSASIQDSTNKIFDVIN